MSTAAVIFADAIIPSGAQNGVNRVFTLPQSPYPSQSLILVLNGVTLNQGLDYSLSGPAITFLPGATIPDPTTTSFLVWYRYTGSAPAGPNAGSYPMSSFQQLYKELTGEISSLPDPQAQRCINRAWKRVNDFRMWSWQVISNAQLFVPPVISVGSCAVTFNSTQVVMDAPATAALNAIAFGNPPLASPILGVGYQIRLGTSMYGLAAPIGPNYTIVAWDGSGNMTIDAPYGQKTGIGLHYQVLKCFYAAPFLPVTSTGADGQFARYLSIVNLLNGYAITGRQLYFSQEELNRIDPQRGGQGDAYILAYLQHNSLGQPVYEMYPNPVNPATYQANYVSKGPLLTMTTQLPQVSYALDDVVTFLAKKFAGQWAMANVSRFKDLQGTNWVQYCTVMDEEWRRSMLLCCKEDDEIMPSPKPFVFNGGYSFPLGGEFLQAHDLSSILPPC